MAYESDHTRFMREWMQKHPEELVEQQAGRALWWDRGARDLNEQQCNTEARVPQKP